MTGKHEGKRPVTDADRHPRGTDTSVGWTDASVGWTDASAIEKKVRKQWANGFLLRRFATGAPFDSFDLPIRGPAARDLADNVDSARRWAADLKSASAEGRRFRIVERSIGGRHLGRTSIPARAVIDSYDQAWGLLWVREQVEAFTSALDLAEGIPPVHAWALAHPLNVIALAGDWPAMLAAFRWLDGSRESGLYTRQVDAPGVDTKFIERHRSALADMLDVPRPRTPFLAALGLANKPSTVRLRFDPHALGLPETITEAVFRLDEIAELDIRPTRALIVENEITYLSVPVPKGGVVLWGKGYDASHPASLRWLSESPVHYWGDIDTHGFAILNQVRSHLPDAHSLMMDKQTLFEFADLWGAEDTPTNAHLSHLDPAEASFYRDLVENRYGSSVRLEQERLNWAWALARVTKLWAA